MTITPNLSIIIVTFNSEKYIGKCLTSIFMSIPASIKARVTVIDNASRDKTLSLVCKKFAKEVGKRLFVIQNSSNVGFSKAVNLGIKSQKANSYLLINPDVVVNRTTIEDLFRCKHKNKSGITGVKTVNLLNQKSGSYFRFPNALVALFDFTNLRKLSVSDKWHKYFYYLDMDEPIGDFEVDVVTGGFMLIDHKVIEKIGLFDERFFMYLEDVDFCLRASLSSFKVYVCKNIITHVSGASSKNKDGIRHTSWAISRKKYFLKHFDLLSNVAIQTAFLFDDLLTVTIKLINL